MRTFELRLTMMSRYILTAIKPEHSDYEIVVGWDGTLGNFFGEVRLPRKSDFDFGGEVLLSIAPHRFDPPYGSSFNRVINAISEYATIDRDLRATLWADGQKEGVRFRPDATVG
jgi:hypothetical protein